MAGTVRHVRGQTEALRESRRRLVAASHALRRSTERDLDTAQQQLSVLGVKLRLLETRLNRAGSEDAQLAADARSDVTHVVGWLREVAFSLHPAVLNDGDLRAALTEAAARTGVNARVDCRDLGVHEPELVAVVYFCCEQAIRNVASHAGEQARAEISVVDTGSELQFAVTDDGRGFDPAGTALSGLRHAGDCAEALSGELAVTSAEGEGTMVNGSVPRTAARAAGARR